MLDSNVKTMVEKTFIFLTPAFYAILGAVVNYFYKLVDSRGGLNSFEAKRFFVTGLFGFTMGIMVGKFLPEEFCCRDGILILMGYMALHIFGFIEDNADKLIERYVDKALAGGRND